MINDPALGRNKAQRAFGKDAPPKRAVDATVAKKATTGVNTKKAPASKARATKTNGLKVKHIGMFDGPRPSYGRYNVSEQAADILNRSLNRKGTK